MRGLAIALCLAPSLAFAQTAPSPPEDWNEALQECHAQIGDMSGRAERLAVARGQQTRELAKAKNDLAKAQAKIDQFQSETHPR